VYDGFAEAVMMMGWPFCAHRNGKEGDMMKFELAPRGSVLDSLLSHLNCFRGKIVRRRAKALTGQLHKLLLQHFMLL
jgi:hypothetical protein